jgi:high-affinity iron transporter
LTGYRAHPALTNLIAFALYWIIVGWLARRAGRAPAAATGRTA